MTLFGLRAAFEDQRSQLQLWWPVFMGLGIGIYFALGHEPGRLELLLALLAGAAALLLFRFAEAWTWFLATALIFSVAGFELAALRGHLVAAPVLQRDYWGGVEGRIVDLDRSARDAPRVLLDRVDLFGMEPSLVPERVRISLQGWVEPGILKAGNRIIVTAQLSAPSAPVEPGAFDFRRHAWFERLGAVGYANTPALLAAPRMEMGFGLWLFDLRQRLTLGIMQALPGRDGAFATAITTGDLSELNAETLDSLRASSLAHMYSISGLHMSLLTAFVFWVFRYGLALVPALALRVPAKKVAAGFALAAALFYLLLSGMNVATQRSFIMVAVMLVAVLLDRAAISMRTVALSALVVLALFPESLNGAGFQMSYAATIALIAGTGALAQSAGWQALTGGHGRWLVPVWMVVLTSILAGLATTPVAAFHFNRITQFGLVANVLAVPVMGIVVMPMAVMAGLLAPLGLHDLPLQVMGWGIRWILAVSDWVAGLDGSVRMVHAGPPLVLALLSVGAIFALIWRGPARFAGLLPCAAGLVLWIGAARPDILVAEDGLLVGAMGPEGRALSAGRGNGYSAETWLAHDGDRADQPTAHDRAFAPRIVLVQDRDAVAVGADLCRAGAIVVAPQASGGGECLLIGAKHLREQGATAIWLHPDGSWQWQGARSSSGTRPWTETH